MSRDLVIIALAVALAVAGFGILLASFLVSLLSPNVVKDRLGRFVELPSENIARPSMVRRDRFSRFRYQMNNVLSVLASRELYKKLQSSNWQITVSEYILIRLSGTALGLLLGWVLSGSVWIGLVAAILGYMIPGIFLYRAIYQRQRKFQDQLVDVLVLIRGAVQAGYSLLQSLEVVVREMPAPASEEFGRVQREVQFGIPMAQALTDLSQRMESDDLYMVVTAIIINSQVGGNLTLMLTAVTETIRNRIALMGEVRALTSYARYVSYLLTMLPFFTALLIFFLSPGYFDQALVSPITQIMFAIALIGILIGNFWLRRIADIKV